MYNVFAIRQMCSMSFNVDPSSAFLKGVLFMHLVYAYTTGANY